MKRKLLIVSAFILALGSSKGQSVVDAYKLTQTELTGTARSMSMGGAFGALGGDVTAISINPAGIGVYKSSEVVATLNFQNVETKTHQNTAELKGKKFNVNFNNFAFVGTFPLQSDVAPLINFGFSYNRLKSFDRKYSMTGDDVGNSLSDHMALRSNGIDRRNLKLGENASWENGENWLSILGYNSFLTAHKENNIYRSTTEGDVYNDLVVSEKGSVNTYDFNAGTTFEDMLSIGMKVSVTDIDYRLNSSYYEEIASLNSDGWGEFGLYNDLKTEGTGWQLGLGAIFKPIHELRIGLAYHSPTWYNMTDYYGATLSHDLTRIENELWLDGTQDYKKGETSSGDYWTRTDYKLRTPDKWVFSLAGVLGKNAILSLDYELVDYSKTKLNKRDGGVLETEIVDGKIKDLVNDEIKAAHRLTSNIRLGGEYRFTPQLAVRAGYSWQQSPFEDKFVKWLDTNDDSANGFGDLVYTAGSVTHYVVPGNTNYITWGLGYRFTRNIYTDLAFVYKTQKADLYAFSKSAKSTIKENSFQGALTLGFRF